MSESAAIPVSSPDKRPLVETLLMDVFRLMGYPAELEFKDMADGSLGVSVHFSSEVPGVASGKRNQLLDCVQFWLNKAVNRPNLPRRWVNLAVDSFPEPRVPGQLRQSSGPSPSVPPSAPRAPSTPSTPSAQSASPATAGRKEANRETAKADPKWEQPRRAQDVDERSLTPTANPALSAAGKALAEKSARHGRIYGVMLLSPDARALMLKAADGVKGVCAKAEGEGHWRRLVMVPDKLTPMPKKHLMADYDDDEDEDE